MENFDRGFIVSEGCYLESECNEILDELEPLGSAGSRCLLDNQWCQVLASRLRDRLAESIPELQRLRAVQCTYFCKSPSRNWLVTWHQDRSIPVADSPILRTWSGYSKKESLTFVHAPDAILQQMIAVRLHLDDSTIENGPLRAIPNSHGNGTLDSSQIANFRETVGEKAISVSQGGVLVMRPLLLHASSKSSSPQPRRVLHFLFGPKELPEGLAWKLSV